MSHILQQLKLVVKSNISNFAKNRQLWTHAFKHYITIFIYRTADTEPTKFPELLTKDEYGELYYKKDINFMQPRAHIYYHIRSDKQLKSLGKFFESLLTKPYFKLR